MVQMIIILIEMPIGRGLFKGKTAIKRQIAPEGKAPGELNAERTSVREHFNPPGNAAPGCDLALYSRFYHSEVSLRETLSQLAFSLATASMPASRWVSMCLA